MKRLDIFLVENSFVQSRNVAKQLILKGAVCVNGTVCKKPSCDVDDDARIEIIGDMPKYVGRGGYKLEKALDVFKINLKNRVCMDIGASTGGFTDCMLCSGARFVYAIDVGTNQLAEKLKADNRVKSLEQTDIRMAEKNIFENDVDFAACDVSFISIGLILEHIRRLLSDKGECVVLVKPQFEAGRSNIGKNGVVKDKKVHCRVIEQCVGFANSADFDVCDICCSPIKGGNGNIEYLMYLKCGFSQIKIFDYKKTVDNAFDMTKTEEFN